MKKVPPPKANNKRPPPPKIPKIVSPITYSSIQSQNVQNASTNPPNFQDNYNNLSQANEISQNAQKYQMPVQQQMLQNQLNNQEIKEQEQQKNQSLINNVDSIVSPNMNFQTYQRTEEIENNLKVEKVNVPKPVTKPNNKPAYGKPPAPIKKTAPQMNKKSSLIIDLQPITHSEETKSKTASEKIKGINPSVKKQVPLPQTPKQKQQEQNTSKKTSSVYSRLQDKLNKLSNARQQLQMSDSESDNSQEEHQVMSQPNTNQNRKQDDISQKQSQKNIEQFNQKIVQKQENLNQEQFYFDEVKDIQATTPHFEGENNTFENNLQLQDNLEQQNFQEQQVQNNLNSNVKSEQPTQEVNKNHKIPHLNHSSSENYNFKTNGNQNLMSSDLNYQSEVQQSQKYAKYQPENSILELPHQQTNQSNQTKQRPSILKDNRSRNVPKPPGRNLGNNNVPQPHTNKRHTPPSLSNSNQSPVQNMKKKPEVKINQEIKSDQQLNLDTLIQKFQKAKVQYNRNMTGFKNLSQKNSQQEQIKMKNIKKLMDRLKQKDEQIRVILSQY